MKTILLILLMIMFMPINIDIHYNQKLTGYLRYLIWRKKISLSKQKNGNNLSNNITNSNNKNKELLKKVPILKNNNSNDVKRKTTKASKSWGNLLKEVKRIKQFVSKKMLKSYIHLLKCFFSLGVRTKVKVDFKVFVKDMERTGQIYGTICAVFALVSIPQNFKVFITPNFAKQRSTLKFNLKANVYPAGVLFIGFLITIRLIYDAVRFKMLNKKRHKVIEE